jgi:cytochrome c-type biogenesis protein
MFETLFLDINNWMVGGSYVAALGCFLWGVIGVLLSPCHLASIPLIIAYVGGQQRALTPKQAGSYAVLFTLGLFITIAVIGIVCALLGRMLGDVGNYWQILIGLVLVWMALGMLGVGTCTLSGSLLYRLKFSGLFGAFALGHCLPIVMAGSFTATVRRLIENRIWQGAGAYFRRGAGVIIGLLGAYFILNPFIAV